MISTPPSLDVESSPFVDEEAADEDEILVTNRPGITVLLLTIDLMVLDDDHSCPAYILLDEDRYDEIVEDIRLTSRASIVDNPRMISLTILVAYELWTSIEESFPAG